jgi:hypothetical protein
MVIRRRSLGGFYHPTFAITLLLIFAVYALLIGIVCIDIALV